MKYLSTGRHQVSRQDPSPVKVFPVETEPPSYVIFLCNIDRRISTAFRDDELDLELLQKQKIVVFCRS